MFTFRFAHVTGLDSATKLRNCEREIVLHATPCHWAVFLGPPQPLRMQAPHSFETPATLTQRHSVTSHSAWRHIFTQSPVYIFISRGLCSGSRQTVTRTPWCVIHTELTEESVDPYCIKNESLFAVTFK